MSGAHVVGLGECVFVVGSAEPVISQSIPSLLVSAQAQLLQSEEGKGWKDEVSFRRSMFRRDVVRDTLGFLFGLTSKCTGEMSSQACLGRWGSHLG